MAQIKTVGIVAPASGPREGQEPDYHKGIKYLENLGLNVICAENLFERSNPDDAPTTAGSASKRLTEFHKIWADPKVDLVIAMRGGYGCVHILDAINYDLIAKNPKPFLGYSDITVLHLALQAKSGLQTYHAPMVAEVQNWHPDTKSSFEELLMKLVPGKRISLMDLEFTRNLIIKECLEQSAAAQPLEKKLIKETCEKIITDSSIKILGGNLSMICSILGTEFVPDFKDSVLFLEEYCEPKYKVDRMLHHLNLAAVMDKLLGVWVGVPTETVFDYSLLEKLMEEKHIPLLKNLPAGHGQINLSLPLN